MLQKLGINLWLNGCPVDRVGLYLFINFSGQCVVPENIQSYPYHSGFIGNSEGEGSLKSQNFSYQPKLEFPEGWEWGVKPKNPLQGGTFSGTTQYVTSHIRFMTILPA